MVSLPPRDSHPLNPRLRRYLDRLPPEVRKQVDAVIAMLGLPIAFGEGANPAAALANALEGAAVEVVEGCVGGCVGDCVAVRVVVRVQPTDECGVWHVVSEAGAVECFLVDEDPAFASFVAQRSPCYAHAYWCPHCEEISVFTQAASGAW